MKSDPRDYKLEISSIQKTVPPSDAAAGAAGSSRPQPAASAAASNAQCASGARPYLSVMFNCCQVYQRVYRDPDGTHYTGRCPKCLRTIKFVVGPGGTAGRSFVVE